VGIAPAGDAVAADYATLLSRNIQRLKALKDTISPAGTGYVYEYDASLYGAGLVAPWQQNFFIQSLGMGSDLEPLADMAALQRSARLHVPRRGRHSSATAADTASRRHRSTT
jgi:hypothetical protein